MTKNVKNKSSKIFERDGVFHKEFKVDLTYWIKTDQKIALRAYELIEAILRNPFHDIGKHEPL